jgi:hypothetical protein
MSEINYFKVFIIYSDVTTDVDYLYIKKLINRFLLYNYRIFTFFHFKKYIRF